MMRLSLLLGIGLGLFGPSLAVAQSHKLTPKQIQVGWLSLFDGETTFGWETKGDVEVKDGKLVLGGEKGGEMVSTTHFGPCEFVVEGDGKKGVSFLFQGHQHPAPLEFQKARFLCGPSANGQGFTLEEEYSDESGELGAGGTIETVSRGPVGIRVQPGTTLTVSKIVLRPLGLESIPIDKELSAWKINPGDRYKSTFTVDGDVLTVKNGPGDIQTKKQWEDFVLQLECRVNGDHLNSGIFFRCIPDQYQQGYEAQIRNEWQGDDRTKPVDFGTGGIYRRQPARMVTSTDGEWFTMTVIAHENHIATWVNGVQVTDFTDERPKADNARQGTKLDAGAISIQGHDPTTDLSFRNFRAAELPKSTK